MGIRKDSADFVYHVDYEMEGLVKRAGSSMMLSVGKLIGEQMKLEGNDRIRKDRIWRRMAFADEWNIEVALPKGYQASAESLKKLNTTVSQRLWRVRGEGKCRGWQDHSACKQEFLAS